MRIKFILYFSFLLAFFAFFENSCALIVKDAKIFDQAGSPTFSISLDETFSPEPDQEDEETLLIEFPEDTQWKAPLSQESNLGLSYTYIPYQDGAGDLVIKKDKRLIAGEFVQDKHNQYSLPFYAQPPSQNTTNSSFPIPQSTGLMAQETINSFPPATASLPTGPLTIKDIRVGPKKKNTRLVLELSRQTKFIIKENDNFSTIYILPTEITQWLPPPASSSSFGFFKGYRLVKLKDDVGIEVMVEKGTRIVQASIVGEKTPNPKLVIDLNHYSLAPTIQNQTTSQKIDEVYTSMKTQNNVLLNRGDSFSVFSEDELVKSLNILVQNNDTIIRLLTSHVKSFDVRENKTTNEVTIHLPKMIWNNVKVTEEKAGLVRGFTVDQSDPEHTNLVFKVDKGTSIIGKKSFGTKGNGRFVVYLNQKEKKTPTWLIDASASELSYDDLEKEEGEVSRLIYQGGISPYTNIGDGFYVGLKASSLAGQQKSHSTHAAYTNNLSAANFGGGAHLLAGYGMNFEQIYAGAELNVGLYGVDSKNSYSIGGTETTSSAEIRASWGLSARLGYYISPTSLLYARMGVNSTNFNYSGSSSSNGEIIFPGTYRRNNRTGFLYGLGLESALNDHISARIEGAQVNYQPFYYRSGTDYKKDRPLLNDITLGIAYKLNPMSGPAVADIYEESVGTGFYFGADGGLSTLLNHRYVNGIDATNTATVHDSNGSTIDPAWGLFAGYSYHQNKFFMAGELQLALTKPVISESIMQGNTTTESYSNKLQWLWALTARPGYIFNHGTIGYGRIGLVGGHFAHSGQHSGTQRAFTTGGSAKSHALGVRLGAGLETFINRHLTVRSDYILDYLPKVKIKDQNNGSLREKINLINNEFKLGLSWYLDP
jgi:outer membrane immunogenic protein